MPEKKKFKIKSKNKRFLKFFAIFIFILGIFITGYIFDKNYQTENINFSTDKIKQDYKEEIDTSGWETYINNNFLFSIKYPNEWSTSAIPNSTDGIMLYKDDDGNEITVYATNKPNSFSTQGNDLGRGTIMLNDGTNATILKTRDQNEIYRFNIFVTEDNQQFILSSTGTEKFITENENIIRAVAKTLTLPKPTPKITQSSTKYFDYYKAKESGLTDRQIFNYLEKNPELTLMNHPNPESFYKNMEKEPSSISRAMAATILTNLNTYDKEQVIAKFTNDGGNILEATKNLAYFLDDNPDAFALALAELNKHNNNTGGGNTSLQDIELLLMEINNTLEDIEKNQY